MSMSSKWAIGAVNHKWFAKNADPWGGLKDGTVCPACEQPRPGKSFFYKKENVYTSLCTNCRRKMSGWLDMRTELD